MKIIAKKLSDEFVGLFDVFGGDFVAELPNDVHWAAAIVTDIFNRTKECIWCCAEGIFLVFANKQQNLTTVFDVIDISLASCTGV